MSFIPKLKGDGKVKKITNFICLKKFASVGYRTFRPLSQEARSFTTLQHYRHYNKEAGEVPMHFFLSVFKIKILFILLNCKNQHLFWCDISRSILLYQKGIPQERQNMCRNIFELLRIFCQK